MTGVWTGGPDKPGHDEGKKRQPARQNPVPQMCESGRACPAHHEGRRRSCGRARVVCDYGRNPVEIHGIVATRTSATTSIAMYGQMRPSASSLDDLAIRQVW